MGTTNSGKSTLLNSMVEHQDHKHNKGKGKTKRTKRETLALTESALPGTTQEMITVE
jgi:ribosome biogenesis GTPase A